MKIIKKLRKALKWIFFDIKFRIISKKNRPNILEKSLFIDCGSNVGQGYTYFKQFFIPKYFDAVLIEPNPNCIKIAKEKFRDIKNIEFLEAAVWVRKEKLKFFGLVEDSRGNTSTGGSILENHNSVIYQADIEKAIEVDALSFSDLLIEKHKKYKNIIVKMDIESAEYEVLQDLINKGTLQFINHIIIEFHSQFFQEADRLHYKEYESKLINEMKSKGTAVTMWI
jgi:FkbM family methyltransferase